MLRGKLARRLRHAEQLPLRGYSAYRAMPPSVILIGDQR